MQLGRLAPRVAVEHRGRARVGAEQAEQHPDGRRLAGAVGPEEAVHLARLDLEVEAVERTDVAERLLQRRDLDDCHGSRLHMVQNIVKFQKVMMQS